MEGKVDCNRQQGRRHHHMLHLWWASPAEQMVDPMLESIESIEQLMVEGQEVPLEQMVEQEQMRVQTARTPTIALHCTPLPLLSISAQRILHHQLHPKLQLLWRRIHSLSLHLTPHTHQRISGSPCAQRQRALRHCLLPLFTSSCPPPRHRPSHLHTRFQPLLLHRCRCLCHMEFLRPLYQRHPYPHPPC